MKIHTRKNLPNIFLIGLSIVITIGVLELLFRYFLPYFPFKLKGVLAEQMRVLGQSSKKFTLPRKYIALVGDSYAQGSGDWLLKVNKYWNSGFHSAHLIHQSTGIDVVTFGGSGSGSLEGLVFHPISQIEFINRSKIFKLENPKSIIVYFYEGNDLNNDLKYIREKFKNQYDLERIYDPLYFKKFLDQIVIPRHKSHVVKSRFDLMQHLFTINFIGKVTKTFYKQLRNVGPLRENINLYPIPPGRTNRIRLDGQEIYLPDNLESPALELTDSELKLGIYIFEQSLKYIRSYFSKSKIGITYIPSPLSTYQLCSHQVTIRTFEGRSAVYTASLVQKRSNQICSLIKKIAKKYQISFVDSREFIVKAAKEKLLHGPVDWTHFNKDGYKSLTDAVMYLLKTDGMETVCDT